MLQPWHWTGGAFSTNFLILSAEKESMLPAVMGKHPDLMVGLPTSTVFPTNDRKFEISQFFRKKFEKI